ncbi:MAG: MGMT family protein [Candidatus Zixiibacteriota bacterium]
MKTKSERTSGVSPSTQRVKNIIRQIPQGKVATYGQIAALAGNPRAARQVVWILHSSAEKDRLPWHRVINSRGRISLKPNYGYEIQKELLGKEGLKFDKNDNIDFRRYLWSPSCSAWRPKPPTSAAPRS